jgi:6-phosphogluconolactonase/glucosamine-6-phosphate isomerase/deaminase
MKAIDCSVPADAGAALAGKIEPYLARGERALLLVSGGSCVDVAVDACARLRSAFRGNGDARRLLSITLADERYGPIDHADSNWRLLVERGFDPSPFDAVPLLDGAMDGISGEDLVEAGLAEATGRFARFLAVAAERHEKGSLYIAAAFGIGVDGHTAGILPLSPAASLDPDGTEYATGYRALPFARITIAPAFFRHIDYAAIWANGAEKRDALAALNASGAVAEIPARLIGRAREAVLFKGDQL